MRKVTILNPLINNERELLDYNEDCLRDSFNRGEAPLATNLMYNHALDDSIKVQRAQAFNSGFAWGIMGDLLAVYTDHGITDTMAKSIEYYQRKGIPVQYRQIGKREVETISIVTFKWNKKDYRTKFTSEHVNRFYKMISKHINIPYRAICITDDPKGIDTHIETYPLWPNPCERYAQSNKDRPNCYYRIKMFDPEIEKIVGPRFAWFDLDAIVLDNIDPILADKAHFKMWCVDGEYMPVNGSLCLHRVGSRPELWTKFDPMKIHPVTGLKVAGYIGSDQAWIASQLTEAEKLNVFGKKDGIYSYRCHIKKMLDHGEPFPEDAKIVFFHGRENPWDSKLMHAHKWIQEAYS